MSSIFSLFKRGLEKTATRVARSITGLFTGVDRWTAGNFEDLEGVLISADFGVSAATGIASELRDLYERGRIATAADIFGEAAKLVETRLAVCDRAVRFAPSGPTVILFAGVNGSGKTTTIGKLAAKFSGKGKKVMLAAADTFRAAAVDQLKLWGERTGVEVVCGRDGADPAAVAFDAAKAAVERGFDILLIDTAGRQQNRKGLMDELAKINRSVAKACPGAPHEVWLTIDASCGSNALSQARLFSETVPVSGLVLTKLDGSGKGGMAVALASEYGLPTFYAGLGEGVEDLQEFDATAYARGLFALDEN